ncbi:MAG TPA: glycosyl hydrolase family 28-related protein, partial [Longimicrobium sp.]|nr:glycosyl hydrolase family 28-related protein [Longimicrobium sp.]
MYLDVSAAPYSANKTGTADARAAFASADAAGGTLYVPRGTYRIDSNLTLSSDVHFEEGAVIRPNANVTVTLNGTLDAGAFQAFDIKTFTGAKVVLGKAERLLPQWWGATGNGSTDDYAPIAAALASAAKSTQYGSGARGAILFFPPGIYRVTKPLDLTPFQMNLLGSGQFQSVIRGDTGRAIIELVGGGYSSVKGFTL